VVCRSHAGERAIGRRSFNWREADDHSRSGKPQHRSDQLEQRRGLVARDAKSDEEGEDRRGERAEMKVIGGIEPSPIFVSG
jgi:hypothetical protein